MLPRLKPRPRRNGAENTTPTELNSLRQSSPKTSSVVQGLMKDRSYVPGPVGTRNSTSHLPLLESKLSSNTTSCQSTESPPPSPRPSTMHSEDVVKTPIRNGGHYKHVLDCSYSSSSVDSSIASDVTLTPPPASAQSLVVAARRLGSAVREANNSQRRRRRRQQYTKNTDIPSVLVSATAKQKSAISFVDEDGDFSWNDRETYATTESSPDEKLPGSVEQRKTMSPEEVKKKYWEMCYGKGTSIDVSFTSNSFSAKRMPPSKGCLSNPRPRRKETAQNSTPIACSSELGQLGCGRKTHHVQFGSPSAVEYDVDSCSRQLTPMPEEKVRGKYSMTLTIPTQEEEEMTIETKHNNAILSEWEGLDETGKKRHKRSGSSSKKKKKRGRRESSLFGQSVLFSPHDDCDAGNKDDCQRKDSVIATSVDEDATETPSDQISESLALLQMSPEEGGDERKESSSDEDNTWEFVANLRSINSAGAACTSTGVTDGSPNSCDEPETTTSDTETSFNDDVHTKDSSSPVEPDETLRDDELGLPDNNRRKAWRSDMDSLIIHQQLAAEHEMLLPDILQSLSRSKQRDRDMTEILVSLDPFCLDIISSTTVDFLKSPQLSSPTRSFEKTSDEQTESLGYKDWRRLELSLMTKVTNEMNALNKELSSMVSSIEETATTGTDLHNLQLEILKLEKKIAGEQRQADTLEAALAPRAAMLCHSTTWMGLFGFDLDQFHDGQFILTWNHMEGLESCVTFRTTADPDFSIHPRCAPFTDASTELWRLHTTSVNMLQNSLKDELRSLDMATSLLRLSKSFAKLDQAFEAIRKAESIAGFSVSTDSPIPIICIRGRNKTVRLTINLQLSVEAVSIEDASEKKPAPAIPCRGYSIPEIIERLINYV